MGIIVCSVSNLSAAQTIIIIIIIVLLTCSVNIIKLFIEIVLPCRNNSYHNTFIHSILFYFNPSTPKILLAILPTVCHTVLVMLVWRIRYRIN